MLFASSTPHRRAEQPAADGESATAGHDVGEFGEIRLAENPRASVAQKLSDGGVLPGARAFEGERAGGRVLTVAGRDVVLDEDGHAGERTAL